MKPQEANKLIAEFMGVYSEENGYDYTEIGPPPELLEKTTNKL